MVFERPLDASDFRFKVEHGIPLPDRARRGNALAREQRHRYPFPWMEVGDSFFVPCEHGRSIHETAHIIIAAAQSAKKR